MPEIRNGWVLVAAESAVPRGEGRRVFLPGGSEAALFNTHQGWYAVDSLCPHKKGPLADGITAGKSVYCPLHNWQFDLSDGKVLSGGDRCVKAYPVKVEDGQVYVDAGG